MIIDAHADYSSYMASEARKGNTTAFKDNLLHPLKMGGITGLVNAIYLSGEELLSPKESALFQVTELKRQLDPDSSAVVVTTEAELRNANKEGHIGIFLSLEGSEPLETLDDLEVFYQAGVRFIGLTHNRLTQYSGSVMHQEHGITPLGYELLERMAHLNMVLDLSHLSDLSTDEALRIYPKTIIASHSNVRTQCNHPRNLTDEQLKRLANRGGVAGLNVCSPFVSPDGAKIMDLEQMVYAMLNHLGEDHVGFGFDFCDRLFEGLDRKYYDTLAGPELATEFLERLKLPERIKDKIAWQNWKRIYQTI